MNKYLLRLSSFNFVNNPNMSSINTSDQDMKDIILNVYSVII